MRENDSYISSCSHGNLILLGSLASSSYLSTSRSSSFSKISNYFVALIRARIFGKWEKKENIVQRTKIYE